MALLSPGAAAPMMSDGIYRTLCALIHDQTGLHFNETSRFFVEKRIEGRLAAIQMGSPEEYYQYLRFDPDRQAEWDALIISITTNETYFMREERQLRCFQRDILPQLAERSTTGRVRIWSAGCSSGEEPYSLAILLKETKLSKQVAVEIYATDINTRVLSRAKEGVYTENSFRTTDAAFKEKWFTESGPGHWRVKDELRQGITFSRFNLFELERYSLLAPFDVIFCRNVIIYFDLDVKVKVVERFYDRMKPGGYLLLGHSESLISVPGNFKLVHLPTDLVYIKGGEQ